MESIGAASNVQNKYIVETITKLHQCVILYRSICIEINNCWHNLL